MIRPSTSRLVGSIQCASSKIISTGLDARQRLDLRTSASSVLLPPLLRGQVGRRIASVVRQPTAARQTARRSAGEVAVCASRASSLSSLHSGGLRAVNAGGAFDLADERIERAVRVLRRAEIARARVRLGRKAFHERSGQPRFADAGLAGEQHHLAFAAPCRGPAPRQQLDLFVRVRPAPSGHPHARHRSGFRPRWRAAPPRPGSARRCL